MSNSGVTRSFEKAFGGIALGGKAGSDLSTTMGEVSFSLCFACAAAFDFLRRLAITDSWQFMQKMPWEVRA